MAEAEGVAIFKFLTRWFGVGSPASAVGCREAISPAGWIRISSLEVRMRTAMSSGSRDQEAIYPAVNAACPRTSFQAASRKTIIFRDWKVITLPASVMEGAIDLVLTHGSGEGETDITELARGTGRGGRRWQGGLGQQGGPSVQI
jgi:hypothetical protein